MREDPEATSGDDLRWCVGLFVGGLLLRLVHLWTITDSPFFSRLILDPLYYDEWARRIAAGDWFGDRPFFQDPLYPYFLGAIYRVLGHRLVPAVAVQLALGALVPPLVLLASRRWFGRAAARIAGLLACGYLPSIFYEGLILKTWMAVLLVAASLWLLSRALAGAGRKSWLGAGLLLGLATLARGNLILCVPLLALWLALDRGVHEASEARVRGRVAAAWLLLGFLVVIGPIAARNRIVGGEWIVTTSNAGQNFYIGNNPHNTDGEYARLPFVDPDPGDEERDFAREAERRAARRLTPSEVSSFWFGEARDWIRADPSGWIRLTWKKARNLWGAYEIPDNLDYYLYRESAPVLRLPLPGWGLVAPLGLLGGCLAWRRRGWPRLLVGFVAVYSTSVVLFFVLSRFRMALLPALLPLAGFALAELARRARALVAGPREGWPAATRAGGLLLLCLAFVHLPVRGRADSPLVRLAGLLGLPLRVETSATAHYNLGLSYAAEAKGADAWDELLRLAESELRLALEEGARYATVQIELGKVLARQGRNREAIAAYREASALEPGLVEPHHAIGLLHLRLEEPAAAEHAFREALALAPNHVASLVRLGELLLDQGRSEEAARTFRRALALAPGHRAAQAGLARALSPSS